MARGINKVIHSPGFADPETGYRAWLHLPSILCLTEVMKRKCVL